MIRRKKEAIIETKRVRSGAGTVVMHKILNGESEMYGKGRGYDYITLNPGCEVGYHVHHGEREVYFIVSGNPEYNDNGNIVTLHPGDTTFTDDGEGHSMINNTDDIVTAIGLVLYK